MRLAGVDVVIYDPDGEEIFTDYEGEIIVPTVGDVIRKTTIHASSKDSHKNDYGDEHYEVTDVEMEFRTKPDLPSGEGMIQMVYIHTELKEDDNDE